MNKPLQGASAFVARQRADGNRKYRRTANGLLSIGAASVLLFASAGAAFAQTDIRACIIDDQTKRSDVMKGAQAVKDCGKTLKSSNDTSEANRFYSERR